MALRTLPLLALLKARFPAREEKELFAEILRGGVLVEGEKVVKPGVRVPADALVSIRERSPFASRAGAKLAAALDRWNIQCAGKTWLDAGAATGGFTDCLLQRGASLVYAIDVGENLIDWRLRNDQRVRVMEGTNVMTLRRDDLAPPPECAVADLSFRSLRRAAAHVLSLSTARWGIFLVKPQFEYSHPVEGFRGVVRETGALGGILRELIAALREEGVSVENAVESPIRGRKGNREFLFLLSVGAGTSPRAPGVAVEDLLAE